MLENLLSVEIITHKPSQAEIDYLIAQEEAARLGLDAFLAQKITFEEYLEVLELAGLDMDEYLLNIENNLNEVGIIV